MIALECADEKTLDNEPLVASVILDRMRRKKKKTDLIHYRRSFTRDKANGKFFVNETENILR